MHTPVDKESGSSRFAVERTLAPHVDEEWAENLLLELRLLGVSGDRIGAALAEVESHCLDSSDNAQDAFGDPVEYARSLNLPVPTNSSGRARLRSVAPTMLQVVGMLVLLWSFTAWRRGEPLELTGGQLITLTGALLSMVAVVRWSNAVIRLVVHHPVLLWCGFMAATATFIVPLTLVDGTVTRCETTLPMGLGTAALLGGLAWQWMRHSPADPITSPLDTTGSPTRTGDRGTPTRLRRFVSYALVRGLIPVSTVIMLGLTAWMTR
jgi:hypothetical protein